MLKFITKQSNVLLLDKTAYQDMQELIVNLNNEQKTLDSSPFMNIKIDNATMEYCYNQLQLKESNPSELKIVLENLVSLIGDTVFKHFMQNSQLLKKFDPTLLMKHIHTMILFNLSGYIQSNSVRELLTFDNIHESLTQLLENDTILKTVSTMLKQYSNQLECVILSV